jgi:hypothetical protein
MIVITNGYNLGDTTGPTYGFAPSSKAFATSVTL